MARTENPFFAKRQIKFYCDDTEPKLYPDAFVEFISKPEHDAAINVLIEGMVAASKLKTEEEKKAFEEQIRGIVKKAMSGVEKDY